MIKGNQHIEEFLDYYCSNKEELNYAVLLKGGWGSGKTYFVKKYIENRKSKFKFLLISLYGLTSFSEIENQIFQQLHPILSSKTVGIAGKILSGTVKAMTSAEIPKISLPKFLKNTEQYIVVFDDLERCSIPISDVLGYINSFVEFQGQKVILIADEEKIGKRKGEKTEYQEIKEKLIGKTFEVSSNFEEAFDYFLPKIQDKKCRLFLSKNKTIILESCAHSYAGSNIRIAIHSIFDFERFFKVLDKRVVEAPDLMKKMLEIFLKLSVIFKKGEITPSELDGIRKLEVSKFVGKSASEDSKYNKVGEYLNLSFYAIILDEKEWQDIFDRNLIDGASINKSLLAYIGHSTETWQKVWHGEQSDVEFEKDLKDVVKKFKTKKYNIIGVILHVLSSLLRYSKGGQYKESLKSIVDDGKKYIDYLFNKGLLQHDIDRDAWSGLGFPGAENKEFQQIFDYFKKKLTESKQIESERFSWSLLSETLKNNPGEFARIISFKDYNEYARDPICSQWNTNEFIKQFHCLTPHNRRMIVYSIKIRYEDPSRLKNLEKELNFLRKLKESANLSLKAKVGKLSALNLTDLITSIDDSMKSCSSNASATREARVSPT